MSSGISLACRAGRGGKQKCGGEHGHITVTHTEETRRGKVRFSSTPEWPLLDLGPKLSGADDVTAGDASLKKSVKQRLRGRRWRGLVCVSVCVEGG